MNKKVLMFLSIVSLSFLMLILVTFSLVIPQIGSLFENGKNLNQDQQKLEKLKSKLSDLEGLNELELANRQAVVVKALPTEKNFLMTLEILGNLATRDGLIVESYKGAPGPVLVKEKGRIDYKMTISGRLDNLKTYLSDIEKTLPLMNPIGKLSMDVKNDSAITSIDVETYYFPLPDTLGVIDQPIQKLSPEEEQYVNLLITYNSSLDSQPLSGVVVGRADPFSF